MSPHFLRVWGETEEFSGCPFDVSLRSLCGCNELLGPSGCLFFCDLGANKSGSDYGL